MGSDTVKLMMHVQRDDYAENFLETHAPHLLFRRFLEVGGEAIVLLVRDKRLEAPRILKIARPDLSEIAKQRFIRSARMLCGLHSDYFPTVLYMNMDPLYILLDWAKGQTLREYIDSMSRTLTRNIKIFRELMDATELLHKHGVIHRDIKPENIIVNAHTKLIDFGIAKKHDDENLTKVEYALGTALYSAPEQIANAKDVDNRADIYSLGQIFYFLWTKQESFAPEILDSQEEIDFFSWATAKERAERIPDIATLREEFEQVFKLDRIKPRGESEPGKYTDLDAFEDLYIFWGNTSLIQAACGLTRSEIAKYRSTMRERRLSCFSGE